MQIDVINEEGQRTGHDEVPEALFAGKINEPLLWEMVKAQRASARRGTHETKTRANVRGGGIKYLKQKGSGQARQGSRRSPNHVGGGTVFGPHPRDYSYRLPRTARRSALIAALSVRAKEGKVAVIEGLNLEVPKTKRIVKVLSGLESKNVLFVCHEEGSLKRSVRNVAKSKGLDAAGLNVYDILAHERLVFTRAALNQLVARMHASKEDNELAGAAA